MSKYKAESDGLNCFIVSYCYKVFLHVFHSFKASRGRNNLSEVGGDDLQVRSEVPCGGIFDTPELDSHHTLQPVVFFVLHSVPFAYAFVTPHFVELSFLESCFSSGGEDVFAMFVHNHHSSFSFHNNVKIILVFLNSYH